MKYVAIVLMSLVSSVAMADGYRCEGQGYRVKMYNNVHRELGTRNAAVLIVSSDSEGTIAVLKPGTDLTKINHRDTWEFEGLTHEVSNGQFAYTSLIVDKEAKGPGALADIFDARLILNADKQREVIRLECVKYRKSER